MVEEECKGKLGAGSSMICSFHSSVNRCENTTPSTPSDLHAIVIILAMTALMLLVLIFVACCRYLQSNMKSRPWCTKSQLPVARCYKPTEGNLGIIFVCSFNCL